MKIFEKTKELQAFLIELKKQGKSIGFTPTMGALHEGHYSLIQRAKNENDVSLCSIFVNPTQFNEASDLSNYPRTLEKDTLELDAISCDILFNPTVEEIYPQGSDYKSIIDLKGLDLVMEGVKRPGHFDGVVQVVQRLIEITMCDRIYMGQKDFQQFTIIRQTISDLGLDTDLVVCPIIREEDGLAKSSRNVRLLPHIRKKASIIYRVLNQSKEWLKMGRSPIEISLKAKEYLDIPGFKTEYFDLIDGHSLQKIRDSKNHQIVVACTAIWAGEVRLIDNMILKGQLEN